MICEACGGDGLIEVGAYRGDEDDPTTRECRLCGGVKPVLNIPAGTPIDKAVEALTALGRAAAQTGITLTESTNGVRRTVTVIEDPQAWAKRTADERNEKLRQENEQRQRESGSDVEYRGLLSTKPTDAVMNKFLRDRWKE